MLSEDAPDLESSSEAYAARFAGPLGEWFLEVQARATTDLLSGGGSALDVGGGHGQLVHPLLSRGFEVTILGSEGPPNRLGGLIEEGRIRYVVGRLIELPFPNQAFDIVLAYRLLPHVPDWRAFLRELCRVARRAVIVDYPTSRSLNAFGGTFFSLKKKVEGDTRPFRVFGDREILEGLEQAGFRVTGRRGEFVVPMAAHRALRLAWLSRALEKTLSILGLRKLLGSPVILRAERGGSWALALYGRSVLKKQKVSEIVRLLGPTEGLRCLDLGSDNGVVSLLLRRRGGRWASADLTPEAVASIRGLVGEDVHEVLGDTLPFHDAEFDRVVVVDMLEHVRDEAGFVRELARVTKPSGVLLVNTPHLKRTLLRRLREALGQTDEKHGHLRPGYTREGLEGLFAPAFQPAGARTYSRAFSEIVDTVVQFGVSRLGKKGSAKGQVVTGSDLKKHRRLFLGYTALYPFVFGLSSLDRLIPWTSGYMLLSAFTRTPGGSRASTPGGTPPRAEPA